MIVENLPEAEKNSLRVSVYAKARTMINIIKLLVESSKRYQGPLRRRFQRLQ